MADFPITHWCEYCHLLHNPIAESHGVRPPCPGRAMHLFVPIPSEQPVSVPPPEPVPKLPFMDLTPDALPQDTVYLQNALRGVLEHYTDADETLANTPGRFVAALGEMLSGYKDDPKEILSKTFEDDCDEIVVLKSVPFTSLCEHHLLVFSGTVDIGYLPGKVVGLSKLARLVDCYSRRLQMQERMTRQVATALMTHLDARGAAVVVRGEHSCMSCRGVKKSGCTMITSCCLGVFRDDHSARMEFLHLCGVK
jgi:GTP cyclohydrolase IA